MLLRTVTPLPLLGFGRDLNRFMLPDVARVASDSWLPPVDIHDTPEALVFSVEVPGVEKEKLELSFKEGVLTIAGTKESQRSEETKGVRLEERSYGSFKRSFRLPTDADAARISASHANGVLTVTVPRIPAVEPAKIAIQ